MSVKHIEKKTKQSIELKEAKVHKEINVHAKTHKKWNQKTLHRSRFKEAIIKINTCYYWQVLNLYFYIIGFNLN